MHQSYECLIPSLWCMLAANVNAGRTDRRMEVFQEVFKDLSTFMYKTKKRLIQQAGLDHWVNEAFNNVNDSTIKAIKAPKRKSSSWSSRANQ